MQYCFLGRHEGGWNMAARTLAQEGTLIGEAESLITDRNLGGSAHRGTAKPAPALHIQLADIIREKIYNREWGLGSKIPSEHELMARYNLARGTVRRAVTLLVDEGLLARQHGKGTYVAEPGLSHAAGTRPFSFAATLSAQGKSFTTRVVDSWATPAPIDVANQLEIPLGSDVMFLRRVRSVDGEPIMCQESWLNLLECPGLPDADFVHEPLFDAVQRCSGRKIKYSRMRYHARVAGKEHGALLGCDEAAAVLVLEQTIRLVDQRPIEWSTTWFKPGQSVVSDAVQPD